MSLHIYKNGTYEKVVSKNQVQFLSNEPDTSHSKNCTAVLTYKYLLQYPWISVSCDTQYEAFSFCQHVNTELLSGDRIINTSMTRRRRCDDGWFMVNGTDDECFSVIAANHTLSYYDARDMCSAVNASLLTVNVTSRSSHVIKEIPEFLMMMSVHHKNKLGISQEEQYDVMYGKILEKDSTHSYLPYIMFFSIPATAEYLTFFVHMNGECNVLERSMLSAIFHANEDEDSPIRGWGVKCRPCLKPIDDVPAVICQKPSKLYPRNCQDNHFTCGDETCVLSIYQCDSTSDCWDGSDEENCDVNLCDNCKNQYVTIPCSLAGACKLSEVSSVPTHSICDGIYSNTTLSQEKYVCHKYQTKHINLLALIINTPLKTKYLGSISDRFKFDYLYEKEKAACSVSHETNYEVERTHKTSNYSKSLVSLLKTCGSLNKVCEISSAASKCRSSRMEQLCKYFDCPGMFKCHDYYCVALSAICDGQYDCMEGEDESVCPLSSCPGLLRCRGENRCIGKDELCNNHVDCLYSADDEIDCHTEKCPLECECIGYSVSCNLTDSTTTVLPWDMNHIKGIILKGNQKILYLHHFVLPRLVYLNVSFCRIEGIVFKNPKSFENVLIIIADFGHNNLTKLFFLRASIFRKVVYLQLSFNKLYTITYGKNFVLKHLVVLELRGNPLNEITVTSFKHSSKLALIDIQYIYDFLTIRIQLSLFLNHQLQIKVSDSLICCQVPKHIACSSNARDEICLGVLKTKLSKISFNTICVLVLFVIFTLVTRQIVRASFTRFLGKKKYYIIILLNHSCSVILNCLYLCGILAVDFINVNIYLWRRGFLCMCLNMLLYTSLEVSIIFKACLVVMVSLQIIYPYKHQCLWLRRTGLFILIIWLIVFSTYFVSFTKLHGYGQPFIFDSICSIGMCGMKIPVNILLSMTCFLDSVVALLCIITTYKAYIAMIKHKKNAGNLQTSRVKSINNLKVILKIAVHIMTEFPFRVCLFVLLAHQWLNGQFTEFCPFIFIFALPSSLILYSFVLYKRL